MKNEAARLVADLIAGKRGKTFIIGGRAYFMPSPTLRTICRAISEFANIDLDFEKPIAKQLGKTKETLRYITRAIAFAVKPNCTEAEANDEAKDLMEGTPEELAFAFDAFLQMASLGEVFTLAASATKYAEGAAQNRE